MSIKHKHIHQPFIAIIMALVVGLIPATVMCTQAYATGDAYFSLSPTGGSYTVGNTLILSVTETSTSGDNVNAAQANLSYPSSLLLYKSMSLNGPFTLCGQEAAGSGSVAIGCASPTAESGTQAIAQISFSVIASGTAAISMTSGSDIDNTNGVSVWNGVLPSASFTLVPVSVPAPTPTTTPTPTPTPTWHPASPISSPAGR